MDEAIQSTISKELYEKLVFYFKYASSAYCVVCPRPNGNHLVAELSSPLTDTQGFIARDDKRKEIVVALRGSASVTDILLDAQILLVPFISPGVKLPGGAKVHSGFLVSWDALSLQAILAVRNELEKHPSYSIVTTGHSLGGSIALLAAVTLQQNFKTSKTRTYSYGAPRTGVGVDTWLRFDTPQNPLFKNKIFSDYINATFGENAHRVVHGNDGVPTMIPTQLGYHHHGIEYWQYTHPESEDTTKMCDPEGEDPTCSACIPSQGVTLDHTNYFGIIVSTPFCL